MPFLVMRRADLPEGLLQIEDLKPNDSQRNYVYDPPGQSGYVRKIAPQVDVMTTGAGPILTSNNSEGLGAYFIDRVEDSGGTALTAAVANAAGAAVVALAQAGSAVDVAAVDAALVAAGATAGTGLASGASTGDILDVLGILAGRVYFLMAGAQVEDGGNAFDPTVRGSFTNNFRQILDTSDFKVSNGAGDIFNFKRADFFYNGTDTPTLGPAGGVGPAITVYADDGTLL